VREDTKAKIPQIIKNFVIIVAFLQIHPQNTCGRNKDVPFSTV
jgi:hypothetical protein